MYALYRDKHNYNSVILVVTVQQWDPTIANYVNENQSRYSPFQDYIGNLISNKISLTWRCYRTRLCSFKRGITTNMIKCNQNMMSGMQLDRKLHLDLQKK